MPQTLSRRVTRARCATLLAAACLLAPAPRAQQQQPAPPPQTPTQEQEDVVRVSSELVQTDVMVFDRDGKFVDGLKADDFELKVDGKPQPVAFFESVKAGSVDEDALLRAARGGGGGSGSTGGQTAGRVRPLDRGRTVIFFVDDVHLSPESAMRTRKLLLKFIDDEIGQNDEAVVASATGQIGFLQQVTGEKTVLRAAVGRLNPRGYAIDDRQRPPMNEGHALAIDQNDPDVTQYFIQQTIRDNPLMTPETALNITQQRARTILQFAANVTRQTLVGFESVVRRAAEVPGRKVVFFVSDGFLIDRRNSDTQQRLRVIADAAARSGVVVYTLDARGLFTPGMDFSQPDNPDPFGQLASVTMRQGSSTQEVLRALAEDTGGRALLNTNALDAAVSKSLVETARYYLLAWRPEGGEGRGAKLRRIEVDVRGRPGLKVMVRRGVYLTPQQSPAEEAKASGGKKGSKAATPAPTPEPRPAQKYAEVLDALKAFAPRTQLPTSLSLGYTNTAENGMVLTASIELDEELIDYEEEGGKRRAVVEVAGALYDDKGGVVSSLKNELVIVPVEGEARRRVIQSYHFKVAPGLYQARFAARDRGNRRVGSATRWVDVPDPKKGFFLGSLFVGERAQDSRVNEAAEDPLLRGVVLAVNRRFAPTSWLRFGTFVYNPTRTAAGAADVVIQVQVFRDDQPVMTTPLRKIQTEGFDDTARVPYAAEVPLSGLPAGRYVLQVTAIDRPSKSSSAQRYDFTIE